MLVPAGILVLVALAAIAVDSSIAFMAQREMINYASGAANDAATVAIPEHELQLGRDARPDANRVDEIVKSRVVGRTVGGYEIKPDDVTTSVNDDTVTVTVKGVIPYVFAPAIPGARDHADVNANASAQLQFR